ncbi:hypothetical protein, partial [Corynebacterium sp. HMSC072A04]|uniref:hypothetical protein n=1 Tax=Corynebacterium sp. HMSC072A04 TaxID=1715045 RepID=UPI001AEFB0A8
PATHSKTGRAPNPETTAAAKTSENVALKERLFINLNILYVLHFIVLIYREPEYIPPVQSKF